MLAIDLEGRGWHCWRNKAEHRGRSPVRLVAALARCSFEEAARITGRPYAGIATESILDKVRTTFEPNGQSMQIPSIKIPHEFRAIDNGRSAVRFVDYLEHERGFERADIMRMTETYGMYYALFGEQRYRVIFTVRHNGELVGWTGRTIVRGEERRYWASEGEGWPRITDYVLWHDELHASNADTIMLVEGPFDALKINVLGRPFGIVSTCFFTAQPSDAQIGLLCDLLPRFRRRLILTDRGTTASTMRIHGALSHLADVATLQSNIKDPGEFSRKSFLHFTRSYSLTSRV